MKGKKIIIALIIINIITIGIAYNLIKKDYLYNKKTIIKAMSGIEYEDSITTLNKSHTDYANSIEESKKKIASAITEKGVQTSSDATLDTMADNIKNISTKKDCAFIILNSIPTNIWSSWCMFYEDEVYNVSHAGYTTSESGTKYLSTTCGEYGTVTIKQYTCTFTPTKNFEGRVFYQDGTSENVSFVAGSQFIKETGHILIVI